MHVDGLIDEHHVLTLSNGSINMIHSWLLEQQDPRISMAAPHKNATHAKMPITVAEYRDFVFETHPHPHNRFRELR